MAKYIAVVRPVRAYERHYKGRCIPVRSHFRTYWVRRVVGKVKQSRAGRIAVSAGKKLKSPETLDKIARSVGIALVVTRAIQEISRLSGRPSEGLLQKLEKKTPALHMMAEIRKDEYGRIQDVKLRHGLAQNMAVIQKPDGTFDYKFGVSDVDDAVHLVQMMDDQRIPIGSVVWMNVGGVVQPVWTKIPKDQYMKYLEEKGDTKRLLELAKRRSQVFKQKYEAQMEKDKARVLTMYYTGQTDKLSIPALKALKELGLTLPPEDEERLRKAGWGVRPAFEVTPEEKQIVKSSGSQQEQKGESKKAESGGTTSSGTSSTYRAIYPSEEDMDREVKRAYDALMKSLPDVRITEKTLEDLGVTPADLADALEYLMKGHPTIRHTPEAAVRQVRSRLILRGYSDIDDILKWAELNRRRRSENYSGRVASKRHTEETQKRWEEDAGTSASVAFSAKDLEDAAYWLMSQHSIPYESAMEEVNQAVAEGRVSEVLDWAGHYRQMMEEAESGGGSF